MKRRSGSLSALTAAALALPGLARGEVQTDYLYSRYDEADIPARDTAGASRASRYSIDTHSLRAAGPLARRPWALKLDYELMSGASPWWVQPDVEGRPVQIMSGASIEDQRVDVQGEMELHSAPGLRVRGALGYSDEDDYSAANAGVELEKRLGQHDIAVGLGHSADRLDPTIGASSPEVIDSASKHTTTAYVAGNLTLSRRTLLSLSLNLTAHDGYLSDPYKRAFIRAAFDTVPDTRPRNRTQAALGLRLRHYLPDVAAALHVDYRYSHDSWKIRAHALDLSWHQRIGENWELVPGLRWSSQSAAEFYAPFYDEARDDGLAASDYRLSAFGSLAFRLQLRRDLGPWQLGGGTEWYEADGSYAVGSVRLENPGLVSYRVIQLRLARRF